MTTDALSPSDDHLAEQLRGFGPLSIVAILAILLVGNYPIAPMGAILVLVWVHLSRTPWSEIGYVRPDSWTRIILAGTLFGIAFKLVMKVLVMPLLGAPAINPAFHYLAGNRAALPGAVYAMIAGAGFGEETVFRGWLFERLGKLLGSSAWAKASIVAITASLFGAAHYTLQGFAGVEQAIIVGLTLGTIVAITGRIWFAMAAHAAFDLTALAIIYWNAETAVAHLVFR